MKSEHLFDSIGRAITSMGAVTFVLLMYITGMIACSHTLFLRVFPESMAAWEKDLAAWAISLSWECTVMVTISNPKHIDKRIPWVIAICSGVIVLFFMEAFDQSITPLQIAQRWFVGILTACIGYIYAHLFYSKWAEQMNLQAMPNRLQEAEATVVQLRAAAQQSAASAHETAAKAQQDRAELKELRAFRTRIQKELTCPHCGVEQATHGTLRSHQGHCKKKAA